MRIDIHTPSHHLPVVDAPGLLVRPGVLALLGITLLGMALTTAAPTGAAEPLRLRLVRWPADLADKSAQCIRGQLYAVRGFGEEAQGVWVADTLESTSPVEPGERVPAGLHVGVADQQGQMGLQIQIADVERVLRAHPEGLAEHAPGVILVGRRPASAGDSPCDPATERLEDGAPVMRRIRDIYAARSDGQSIEILME
jgi:hypothetical protein